MDVIIVNWNSGRQLKNCVDSLFRSSLVGEIVIVDNCSSDCSEKPVVNLSRVKFIQASVNLGFGMACNLGAQQVHGDFLLFLNPDAALYPGAIERSMAFMQDAANEQVGICGVQLLDESGHVARNCTRFPIAASFLWQALGLDRVFPRLGHFMTEWPHDQTREVDHVIGAFFLVRRKVFEELGGFDERFFVYLEDLDFSYRARQAGWRTVYLADVQAFHAGGGTSNQIKAKRLFYSLRSRLLYAFKHFSLPGAWLVLLSTLLLEPVSRSALAVARRSLPGLKETWSAYAMLWRWLPQWVFKGVTR